MKKVFLGFGLILLMVLVVFAVSTTTGQDDGENGVRTVPRDRATYGNVTFEPPDYFIDGLPLEGWVSGDTGVQFIAGHGVVLDVWTFSVTGISDPNALAFNSIATNADGTKPRLPAILKFDPPVQNISMLVGSSYNAGATAKIKAYSTSLSKIDEDSVSLTAAMKTMTVSSASANIELLLITGPQVLVVDNIMFY